MFHAYFKIHHDSLIFYFVFSRPQVCPYLFIYLFIFCIVFIFCLLAFGLGVIE